MRIAVCSNEDEGLAHGEARDALAVRGVADAAAGVLGACRENGWEAVPVAVTRDLPGSLARLRDARPDVVVNLVESVGGDARLEAAFAGLLEWLGVPYTGSPPDALALALDKPRARAVLASRGVPVAAGVVLDRGDEPLGGLPFPAIVKPSREDASHGISAESVIADERALRARARWVIETYRQPALAEEFVDGREFNVTVLGAGDVARVLPFSEIDFSAFAPGRPRLVTYEGKWVEGTADYGATRPRFPDDLPPSLSARLAEVALGAARALGTRDYARVDVRVHAARGPLVLEVNPNPDLSPGAGVHRAVERAGIGFPAFVRRIVEDARARAVGRPCATPAAAISPEVGGTEAGRVPGAGFGSASGRTITHAPTGGIARGDRELRPLRPGDRAPLERILRATGAFTEAEVAVALELIDHGLSPDDRGYRFLVAEADGAVVGYSCFGEAPCTVGTYDLYWIAVDPALQGGGVGRALLRASEDAIRRLGGRMVLVETASKPSYAATRAFYDRTGYREVARVPDFYAPGDDKIVYRMILAT